jgi:hypothetical protein
MQLLDTPRTGKLGPHVFYTDASGQRQFCRIRAIPTDPKTPAQSQVRARMGYASSLWSLKLTEPQREQWIAAALHAPSHPWLGRYSHLSGQQLEVKINLTLACTGKPLVLTPPDPVAFAPNPVIALDAVQDPAAGVRLLLSVGTVSEDIMVFGQPPCSAGRMKHRRVYYLGLLGSVTDGQADITDLYTARFGVPAPGRKVFIVTCQTRNGWKAQDQVFRAIIPPKPDGERSSTGAALLEAKAAQGMANALESPVIAAPEDGRSPEVAQSQSVTPPAWAAAPGSQVAPFQASSSVSRAVYMGSTPDAREVHKGQPHVHPVSIPCTPLVHSLWLALRRLGALGMFGPGAEGGAIG